MNTALPAGVLGVGVIGCGRAAADLHLPALSRVPGLKVTALCDSDMARLTQVGRAWGIASLYRDHGDLLGDPAVQVILIAVPTPEHHDVFLRATQTGKHVYVEKPLALDLAQADRMLAAAATSRGRTVLGFNLRSHRLVRRAQACIRSGALGRVPATRAGRPSLPIGLKSHGPPLSTGLASLCPSRRPWLTISGKGARRCRPLRES